MNDFEQCVNQLKLNLIPHLVYFSCEFLEAGWVIVSNVCYSHNLTLIHFLLTCNVNWGT